MRGVTEFPSWFHISEVCDVYLLRGDKRYPLSPLMKSHNIFFFFEYFTKDSQSYTMHWWDCGTWTRPFFYLNSTTPEVFFNLLLPVLSRLGSSCGCVAPVYWHKCGINLFNVGHVVLGEAEIFQLLAGWLWSEGKALKLTFNKETLIDSMFHISRTKISHLLPLCRLSAPCFVKSLVHPLIFLFLCCCHPTGHKDWYDGT